MAQTITKGIIAFKEEAYRVVEDLSIKEAKTLYTAAFISTPSNILGLSLQ
ncbi:hypothetical protein [Photobacterium minamisatsumaniensis]